MRVETFLFAVGLLAFRLSGQALPALPNWNAAAQEISSLPPGYFKYEAEGNETDFAVYKGVDGLAIVWKGSGSNGAIAIGPLPLGKEKGLRFAAKGKAEQAEALVRIQWLDAANRKLAESVSPASGSTGDWTELSVTDAVPEKATQIRLLMELSGRGRVFFREPVLEEATVSKKGFAFDARCLPVETTRLWNGNRPLFSTFADSPCPLTFHFKGQNSADCNPALIVELPKSLRLLEAFMQHPKCNFGPVLPMVSSGRAGYVVYRFERLAIFNDLGNGYGWRRMLTLGVLPDSSECIGREFPAYWHVEYEGIPGIEHDITIRILPPLAELPMPSRFYAGNWLTYEDDYPTDAVFELAAIKLRRSNLIGRCAGSKRDERFRMEGWHLRTTAFSIDTNERMDAPSFAKELQARRIRTYFDRANKRFGGRLCPSYVLNNQDHDRLCRAMVRKKSASLKDGEIVCLDSEPWGAFDWCYDDECLASFARFCGLDVVPDIRTIRTEYADKWVEFRVWQTTKITEKYNRLIREVFPNADIWDYDYPIDYREPNYRREFRRCAKDPIANEQFIDAHLQSHYYSTPRRLFDTVKVDGEHFNKPIHLILAIDPLGYLRSEDILSPERMRVSIEIGAALGVKSVWFYSGTVVDGTMVAALQQSMAAIARSEEFYQRPLLAEKLVCLETRPQFDCTLHLSADGKRLLMTLFNLENRPGKAFWQLQPGFPASRAIDPDAGMPFAGDITVRQTTELPAYGIRRLVFAQ